MMIVLNQQEITRKVISLKIYDKELDILINYEEI